MTGQRPTFQVCLRDTRIDADGNETGKFIPFGAAWPNKRGFTVYPNRPKGGVAKPWHIMDGDGNRYSADQIFLFTVEDRPFRGPTTEASLANPRLPHTPVRDEALIDDVRNQLRGLVEATPF